MVKIYKKTLILGAVTLTGMLSLNYSSGPALNGISVTGAPIGNYPSSPSSGTCSSCHSGGSFGATASIQLYSGTSLVTGNIVPGWVYTVRITRSASGVPVNGGWGFQITCLNNGTNANINAWGTAPTGTANRTLSSRNYIEHTGKISNAITQVNIPWTAPSISPGTVIKFYAAVNTVDGTGSTGGDQVVSATAQYTQAPLSVSWLYFTGRENGAANLLEWAVSNEKDNDFYTIEKSEDGIDYAELARVKANHDPVAVHTYSTADAAPLAKTYYRIKQTDVNGEERFFKTIQIARIAAISTWHHVSANSIALGVNSDDEKEVTATITGMDGAVTARQTAVLKKGDNVLSLEKPQIPGIYVLHVCDAHTERYKAKILITF